MTERTIFLAAIEIADPAERAGFLDQACGSNAELRSQVEALLNSHQQSSQFLETPATAGDSAVEMTIVTHDSGADDDDDQHSASLLGEAELKRYLQPATRPGWLGRLAHYEIEKILGRGAFGIVAKAFDEKLHRVVAIKFMNPELAATSPPRKRFLREARTAAAVRNENIVGIHAVEEEPLPYLVMEYVPGITLQQRLDQNGPLELTEILRIGQQVAVGMAAAHAANLIHRDIKPSNILLEEGVEKRAKISDFGLARAVDDASLTSSGLIAGTPMYMAPEQARGDVLDHRADLFSMGSVLYQMASGRPPFRAANTVAVLKRVCEDIPRPIQDVIPDTPNWLCTIIVRLLEKDPANRFQTAKELAALFARCQSELQFNGNVTCVPVPQSRHHSPSGESDSSAPTAFVRPSPNQNRSEPTDSSRSRKTSDRTLTSPAPFNRTLLFAGGFIAVAAIITVFIINRGSNNTDLDLVGGGRQPIGTSTSEIGNQKSAIKNSSWHGWPADAPPPAIAPFNAEQAQHHQGAWAKYLGVPVEYTNTIGMKFRLIPPGEFTMGSTAAEIEAALKDVGEDKWWQECIKSEAPQHKVILTQPIYLGVTEVTQAEYEKVMGSNPSHFAPMGMGKEAVAGLETAEHPVGMVSWNDAADFCAKLSKQEKSKPFYFRAGDTITPLDGTGYRLPSEAEWEFACRAGTTTKYWIGDTVEDLVWVGWFDGNSRGRTHASGELKANPFGLSDTHGNAWEWVQDGWDINPNSPFPAGSRRVFRGGGWGYPAFRCRSSDRDAAGPTHRGYFIGFRVSLVLNAVTAALADCDRAAAEYVVNIGSQVTVRINGVDRVIAPFGQVPHEPFQLTEVWLFNNHKITNANAAIFRDCRNLTHLYLGGATISDEGLAFFRNCRQLTNLGLNTGVTDAGLIHFKDCKKLVLLHLGGETSDIGLAYFRGCKDLQELILEACHKITDKGLDIFNDCTKVKLIDIRNTQITRSKFEDLKKTHPRCKILSDFDLDDEMSGENHRSLTTSDTTKTPGSQGWPADAPPPAIAPFDADQAKHHQAVWAKYLGVPVEYTNSIGMKFRLIPPGEFTMGSSPKEIAEALKVSNPDNKYWQECIKSEAPQHKVILTQPIYMGVNEVTQAEYENVMGVNPSHFAPMGTGKEAVVGMDTASHPVEGVSWNDAAEFCAKLSKQEEMKPFYFRAGETITPLDGTGYRLPTEAEWEYACRAGTTTKYWIGDKDEDLVRAGWFADNTGGRTHTAGELKANPYGLYDIHGNVWEWVRDVWDAAYYSEFTGKPAVDPGGPSSTDSRRVVRGGHWYYFESRCRAADRFALDPSNRHDGIGFRVSLVADAVRTSLKLTGSPPSP